MAEKKEWENDDLSVQRGDYGKNRLADLIFVAGRLASGPLQWAILRRHPLQRFGVPPPPSGGFITVLGITAPRLPFLTALMPTVLGTKHAAWSLFMASERMTVPFAFFGVLVDIMYESTNTLVFSAAANNPMFSERLYYAGMTIYYTGVALELFAEIQRIVFKSKPENKGKLCTSGFWSITRHINYTANVLFGLGVGLAVGGPAYAILPVTMYLSNFTLNAIPSIEGYCARKYGQAWSRYVEQVPSKLIPWIY